MFEYRTEKELQAHVEQNFNKYFDFALRSREDNDICGWGTPDFTGISEDALYIIEIKRDVITKSAVNQLLRYLESVRVNNKKVVGIVAAPQIKPDALEIAEANNVLFKAIDGVNFISPVTNSDFRVKWIRFDDDMLAAIEDYRATQSPIPPFTKAIRDLLDYALTAKGYTPPK